MDICIAVKPILALVRYQASTVAKDTASLLCLILRLVLDNKVMFTFLEQVLTDLKQVYSFLLSLKGTESLNSFSPGLCAPSNVTLSPAGQDHIVSWSQVAGAETYVALATANDGHNYTCSSNSSNSCNLTNLHCGDNYTITVVTVEGGCYSKPSAAVVLKTGNRKLGKQKDFRTLH